MEKDKLLEKIAKDSGTPKENIAGVMINKETNEIKIFTRDQIVNQLQKVCSEINASFDEIYASEFADLSSELSELGPIIHIGLMQAHGDSDQILVTCGSLLRNALNTIVSSIQTLRSGFRLQSGMLLRGSIEMCATATHLLLEPDSLPDFQNDKLKSTKLVSQADKKVPIFGKAWGLLSNKQIHINSLHTEWFPMKEYVDKTEIPAEVTLGMIRLTAMILRVTSELVFFNHIDEHNYWKFEAGNGLTFIPPNDDTYNWIKEKLQKN